MNARYVVADDPSTMGAHYGLAITDNFPPRYNVAPSQPVPIIRAEPARGRYFGLVRWGFVPGWDRAGTMFKRSIVNIRSETAAEKPSFKHAWRRRHCLFPMNAFYEWLDAADGKDPYCIAMNRDMPLFSLAGLWEHWVGADGSEMETAAFLTRDAVHPLTALHDRMPVFVPPAAYDAWLYADERDDAPARAILALAPPTMEFWRVSRRVNSWRPDDARLTEPVSAATPLGLF